MTNKEDIKYVYDLVSKRIRLFRKYRGLTQEDLAEKTTFSRGLIGNIESSRTTQTFSLAVLYSFATILNIPLEMFVKEDISDYLKKMNINEEELFKTKKQRILEEKEKLNQKKEN
jgi:transcriptional regulator with XRE-family HTH domain